MTKNGNKDKKNIKLDNITFVFAAKSLSENNAAVLKRWVLRK